MVSIPQERSRRGTVSSGALGPGSTDIASGPHPRLVERFATKALAALICIGVLSFGVGLVRFADQMPRPSPEAVKTADAIAVLTGGERRVAEAVSLVLQGRGQRLLISGVNDHTSTAAIADAVDQNRAIFDCCVDIDKRALNTVGNAAEIARWTRAHRYRSLVVVTGAYHMPRALAELRRVLPDTELIPDAVLAPGLDLDAWWSDERTARLVVSEYVKYLVFRVRGRLFPSGPDGTPSP